MALLKEHECGTSALFYETPEARIHYRLAMQAGKPALVLIHPAFADSRIFGPQIEAFRPNHSILAVDLLGHGQSRALASTVTLADMPKLILEIMDRHRIDRAHLVGVSMGSLVAQNLAAQFPERVRSVMVVGGYSIHQNVTDSSRAQRREFIKWIPMVLFSMPAFRRYVTRQSVRSELGKELFSQGAACFTRRSFRVMQGAGKLLLPDRARPAYPLKYVCGELDNPDVLMLAQKAASQDPATRFEWVKDAGHCANVDNPDAFNRVLAEFLESAVL